MFKDNENNAYSALDYSLKLAKKEQEKKLREIEGKNTYTNRNLNVIISQNLEMIHQNASKIKLLEKQNEELQKQLLQMKESEALSTENNKKSMLISIISLVVAIVAIVVSIFIGIFF